MQHRRVYSKRTLILRPVSGTYKHPLLSPITGVGLRPGRLGSVFSQRFGRTELSLHDEGTLRVHATRHFARYSPAKNYAILGILFHR